MGGQSNMNYFKMLPFHGVTYYDIEREYTSIKNKLLNIMENDEFKPYLKENKFERLFNPFDSITCQYYDENGFISTNGSGDVFLNIPLQWLQLEQSENQQLIPEPRMRLWLLPTLAVSGVIEHIELDKGLDMIDKAGLGGKKMNKSEMT